ncbi:MAG: DUF167 family protein [Asticcacaulis sp.]
MARLVVRLTPKAAKDQIDGWGEDEHGRAFLKVRVRARPVEGQANAALLLFLSKVLRLPGSRLEMVAGDVSRLKQIEIEGVEPQALRAAIDAAMVPNSTSKPKP